MHVQSLFKVSMTRNFVLNFLDCIEKNNLTSQYNFFGRTFYSLPCRDLQERVKSHCTISFHGIAYFVVYDNKK